MALNPLSVCSLVMRDQDSWRDSPPSPQLASVPKYPMSGGGNKNKQHERYMCQALLSEWVSQPCLCASL